MATTTTTTTAGKCVCVAREEVGEGEWGEEEWGERLIRWKKSRKKPFVNVNVIFNATATAVGAAT